MAKLVEREGTYLPLAMWFNMASVYLESRKNFEQRGGASY